MKPHPLLSIFVVLFLTVSAHAAGEFRLTSASIEDNGELPAEHIFNGFGCAGGNRSPQLSWQGEPAGTKSFAVTVYDPDAPTGSGWWHWLVFNIPRDVHNLEEGSGMPGAATMPRQAVQARTDFGAPGYGGACPPPGHGKHRYQFVVWALDVEQLPLNGESSGAMLGFHLRQHVLAKAELTATYAR
jgi:Raf kinase inhibitor-like YbhB/YbcL family protein